MMNNLTTSFIARLRDQDARAWFELWETFGPVLEGQLAKWGRGRIGPETVRDLSQETLTALTGAIDRYDPAKGARFSTWLLAIAKHTLGDEIDKRSALKRGGGKRAASLEEDWMASAGGITPDQAYERAVFRAKVLAALRLVEKECEFTDFEVYRMRALEGRSGKEVADALGTSEPTVSRRLARVRTALRARLAQVIATYSFTPDELAEAESNGLVLEQPAASPAEEAAFDDAVGEIHRAESRDRTGAAW